MKILALDFSKTSTGAVVSDINFETLKIIKLDIFTIAPKIKMDLDKSNASNIHFVECRQIFNQIKDVCQKEKIEFCIVEHPIFGTFSTDLAYYMYQNILEILYDLNIDVIGIVPMRLKSYIKELYKRQFKEEYKTVKKSISKKEIEMVYKLLKENDYFSNIPIHKIKNNDEMDAFFLTLFILENMNRCYLENTSLNKMDTFSKIKYEPVIQTEYNFGKTAFSKKGEFFTFTDKKFYPFKFLKSLYN